MRRQGLLQLHYGFALMILFGLFGSLGLVCPSHAHEPGLSAAALRFADDALTVHLTFSRRELEALAPIPTDRDGMSSLRNHALARRLIEINQDGQRLTARTISVQLDASDALHIRLTFDWRTGSQLHVHAPVLTELARGHRQYLSVDNAAGALLANRMLDAGNPVFKTVLDHKVPTTRAFSQFLYLGVEHIVMGYDHLLFLFALLIVCQRFWRAWRIITSFTIAHSITLVLATLDWVQLPSSIVEPLIAVSIVYVGLENVLRCHWHRREWLTFGFGLIHGLGFASTLRELGIDSGGSEIVIPLLAFNLGVELGQVGIALLLLPVIGNIQRLPHVFTPFATACSILVMLSGAYWLCERTIWS